MQKNQQSGIIPIAELCTATKWGLCLGASHVQTLLCSQVTNIVWAAAI